jgi:glycerophosphoryl diester phosphodiesterase
VDGLCVGGNPVANPSFISQAKAANLKFFVYTIDDGSKARRFARMGVDGIITNRPDYIRESL